MWITMLFFDSLSTISATGLEGSDVLTLPSPIVKIHWLSPVESVSSIAKNAMHADLKVVRKCNRECSQVGKIAIIDTPL